MVETANATGGPAGVVGALGYRWARVVALGGLVELETLVSNDATLARCGVRVVC